MFRVAKPPSADIERSVEQYARLDLQEEYLSSRRGLQVAALRGGFAHDVSRSHVGTGRGVFDFAVRAFEEWKQFDLGWVRVANPMAGMKVGQIIAVEVQALGLWSLNLSQIVSVTGNAEAFGFIYKTTPHHAEEGEERFLLTFDPASNEVHYELEAVSRPQHWLARLGYPVTRALRHKFARDSHRRMRDGVSVSRRD